MANLVHIARPYALAAFECARESEQLPAWKAFLESASIIAKNPSVQRLLANPETQSAQLYELFDGVLSTQLNDERRNLLKLLAQNKRLPLLPDMSDAFNVFCEQLEKISKVRMVTALAMEDKIKQKFVQALTKRVKHDVVLHCEVDPSILGGAIIHFGDNVIDGSIRGKLTRLLEFSLR